MRLTVVLAPYAITGALVAGPAFRDPPRDDFPFSNYPMFSEKKDPRVTIQQVLAHVPGGPDVVLPPSFVANEEVMQAASTIRRAMSAGPERLRALCAEIAVRVESSGREDLREVTEVRIRSQRHHAVRYFEGEEVPEHEEILISCAVRR